MQLTLKEGSERDNYPTGNNNTSNNREESEVSQPSLPLERHHIRKHGREKRRRCADGLVKRNRQKPQRDVTEDHRHAEDEAQSRDLEELDAGSDRLHRDHLEPSDGDVAEEGAGGHVAHGEEDRVFEPVVAEEVLVQ